MRGVGGFCPGHSAGGCPRTAWPHPAGPPRRHRRPRLTHVPSRPLGADASAGDGWGDRGGGGADHPPWRRRRRFHPPKKKSSRWHAVPAAVWGGQHATPLTTPPKKNHRLGKHPKGTRPRPAAHAGTRYPHGTAQPPAPARGQGRSSAAPRAGTGRGGGCRGPPGAGEGRQDGQGRAGATVFSPHRHLAAKYLPRRLFALARPPPPPPPPCPALPRRRPAGEARTPRRSRPRLEPARRGAPGSQRPRARSEPQMRLSHNPGRAI